MLAHLDVVVAQSVKYPKAFIGDVVNGVWVSQSGKNEQTTCMYTKQNIFSFCLIIFDIIHFLRFLGSFKSIFW